MRTFLATSCLAGCLLCLPCQALEWEQTRIELPGDPCALETIAVFECTNPLDRIVRITDIQTHCGCTVARPSTSFVRPGGHATLLVTLAHEHRQGPQEKSIVVRSDDQETGTQLILAVDLPVVVRLQSDGLIWNPGETLDWKSTAVEIPSDSCLELAGIRVMNGDFTAELISNLGRHEIRARPTTNQPQSGVVAIRTQSKNAPGQYRVFQLFLTSGL